jgi:hypothetical protein
MSKDIREQLALPPAAQAVPTEQELLAQWGFLPRKLPPCSGCDSGTRPVAVIAR